MQKILLLACICLSFCTMSSAYAGPTDNLNSTGFIVDLAPMDPFGSSTDRDAPPPGKEAFTQIIKNITEILLFMIPIIAAVSFLFAGYYYIFSAGDSEKANKAKMIIKWNIVAILVAFLSLGIVKIVASFF